MYKCIKFQIVLKILETSQFVNFPMYEYKQAVLVATPHASTNKLLVSMGSTLVTEVSYWKSYRNPIYIRLQKSASGFTPPTSVSFSQSDLRSFAVCHGTRVGVYGRKGGDLNAKVLSATQKKVNSSNKRSLDEGDYVESDNEEIDASENTTELASPGGSSSVVADRYISCQVPSWCCSHRADGRLLAIGGYGGMVNVCDTTSRATLRTFGNFRDSKTVGYTRSVAWLADGDKVIAGGDDSVLRVYSLSSGTMVSSFAGHGDAIRCLLTSVGGASIVVSGSYDHTIRVWDVSSKSETKSESESKSESKSTTKFTNKTPINCLTLFDHGHPVEVLLQLGDKNLIVSGGGTFMKVWDLVTKTCIHSVSNHSKTISCLCLAPFNHTSRIISGGMDGHLKIYDVEDFTLLQQQKYNAAVTCVGVSPDASRFVIGTSDGIVVVKQREANARPDIGLTPKKKVARSNTFNHFNRGGNENVDVGDYSLEVYSKKKLKPFDQALKGESHSVSARLLTKTRNIYEPLLKLYMRSFSVRRCAGQRLDDEAALHRGCGA